MQYVTITPETSNVHDITEKVRKGFCNENLILVQANGLKIEENSITSGEFFPITYRSIVDWLFWIQTESNLFFKFNFS